MEPGNDFLVFKSVEKLSKLSSLLSNLSKKEYDNVPTILLSKNSQVISSFENKFETIYFPPEESNSFEIFFPAMIFEKKLLPASAQDFFENLYSRLRYIGFFDFLSTLKSLVELNEVLNYVKQANHFVYDFTNLDFWYDFKEKIFPEAVEHIKELSTKTGL